MSSSARLAAFVALSASLAVAVACGSESDSKFGDGSSGQSSGGGGESSGGNGFGGGGNGSNGGASGGPGADAGNCFAPVDMYIMFDKSGSMNNPLQNNGAQGDCNVGETKNSKWCRGINALAGYLKSPNSKDQGAALQLFSGSGNNTDCQTGGQYSTANLPATSYTTLPSNSFEAALNSAVPNGGTPMEAALRGLTTFTAANRRGGRVTIGILVTDGDPDSNCNDDLDDLAALLKAHYDATKIRTYVIGMNGATFSKLEQLAVAGGAPSHAAGVGNLTNACGNVSAPCHFWNVGDGDPAGFIQALAAIQESADGCKPGGGTVNPVN